MTQGLDPRVDLHATELQVEACAAFSALRSDSSCFENDSWGRVCCNVHR